MSNVVLRLLQLQNKRFRCSPLVRFGRASRKNHNEKRRRLRQPAMSMVMITTVGACPCQALGLLSSASRRRRISASSSDFGARSLELISKVQIGLVLSNSGRNRRRDETRRSAESPILLRIGADSSWEKEEARWLREEQRWLREEERWLREQTRWSEEKQALVEESTALKNQVAILKFQLEEVRSQLRKDEVTDVSLRNLVAGMKTLLQALSAPVTNDSLTLLESEQREIMQIPTAGIASESSNGMSTSVGVKPPVIVAAPELIAVVTTNEVASKSNSAPGEATSAVSQPQSTSSIAQTEKETGKSSVPLSKKSRTLKSGMDGDDVKELQEALSRQGFYSGEEEIEFSMFSDGTESAVKTWQATIGVPEDGQVTAELLGRLLGVVVDKAGKEKESEAAAKARNVTTWKKKSQTVSPPHKQEPASRASREIDRYERTDAEDTHGSQRRVYLLGENRWEEPGRLIPKKVESKANGKANGMKVVVEKCFACSGVGTMFCTECEGTGDLSVEEQFLEWVDDEPKCPYCAGVGAVPCDICDGQGVQAVKK